MILADPTQLNQIMMNFCTNAYYAMEEKGGTLNVILEKVELEKHELSGVGNMRSGYFVKLTISDTGIGISPHLQERIFEPYFTTKDHGKGTGMGLAMMHGIVENHKGFITLDITLSLSFFL